MPLPSARWDPVLFVDSSFRWNEAVVGIDCFVAALLAMTFKQETGRRGRLPRKELIQIRISSSLDATVELVMLLFGNHSPRDRRVERILPREGEGRDPNTINLPYYNTHYSRTHPH